MSGDTGHYRDKTENPETHATKGKNSNGTKRDIIGTFVFCPARTWPGQAGHPLIYKGCPVPVSRPDGMRMDFFLL